MPDSLQSFPLKGLSYMIKDYNIYYDDSTDKRVRRYIALQGCCDDYIPLPIYIYRHVKLNSSKNLIAYFEYNDKGILKRAEIQYHAELPYHFADTYLMESVGTVNKLGVAGETGNICWKEAINLSRFYGINGRFPYVKLWTDCFYDSTRYERIDCYIVVGENKKFVKIDSETGKVLKIGHLKDTIQSSNHYWKIPIQSKYIDRKRPKRRL